MTYLDQKIWRGSSDLWFHKLPTVVEKARAAVQDPAIVGYLLCALERTPRMTGLLFCDDSKNFA